MARKKWPDGATLFSLRHAWNEYWPKGAVVELCEIDRSDWLTPFTIIYCKWNQAGSISRHGLYNLRPLTPAAEAMLAIAKAGGK